MLLEYMKNLPLRSKVFSFACFVVISFYVSAGGEDVRQLKNNQQELNAGIIATVEEQKVASAPTSSAVKPAVKHAVQDSAMAFSDDSMLADIRQAAQDYQQKSQQIEQQREQSVAALNAANLVAEKSYLELDKRQAELVIFNQQIEQDKKALSTSLDDEHNNADRLFKAIKGKVAQRKQKLAQLEELKTKQVTAKEDSDKQLEILLELDHQVGAIQIDTKQKIGAIAKKHLSGSKSFTFSGAIQCQTGESLKQCMNKASTRSKVVDSALKSYFSNAEKAGVNWQSLDYKVLNFEYLNVMQDWHGVTQFQAQTKLVINVDHHLLDNLYALAGLPDNNKVSVVLNSNQYATYYVDGKQVGRGVNKLVLLDKGTYTIKAEYKGKVQSSREQLSRDKKLFYKL